MPEMAAEPSKSPRNERSHNSRNITPQQSAILKAKAANPNCTNTQLSKITNIERTSIVKTLQRYGVDHGALESYQKNRAEVFDGMCSRLLASVTDADINKATLMQRMASVGVLYDKMRIERGLSDGTSKPLVMIQVNGVANPSITSNTQPIDISTHDSTVDVDIPPSVPPSSQDDNV